MFLFARMNPKMFCPSYAFLLKVVSSIVNAVLVVSFFLNSCNQIQTKGGVRVVCIAGPTSSGKTTFAAKLCAFLGAEGIFAHGLTVMWCFLLYRSRCNGAFALVHDFSFQNFRMSLPEPFLKWGRFFLPDDFFPDNLLPLSFFLPSFIFLLPTFPDGHLGGPLLLAVERAAPLPGPPTAE